MTLRFSEGCSPSHRTQPTIKLELSGRLAAAGLAERRQLLDGVVRDAVGTVLKITPSRLDPRKALGTMGLNSLMAMELRNRLEMALGRPLSATLAWNYPTVEAIVAHLAGAEPAAVISADTVQISTASHRPVRPHESSGGSIGRASCCGIAGVTPMGREMKNPTPQLTAIKLALIAKETRAQAGQVLRSDPIAIVGMACRVPGGGDTPARLWQLLRNGVDTVRAVPADRWNGDAWYDPDLSATAKSATKWGGFLDRIDEFDADYFGILPREAERMDPQQRLFLEVAIEAIDDAGLPHELLRGTRTGVYIASYHNDYAQLQYNDPEAIDLRTLTGTLHSVLANRLSYFLDLRSPSMSIDTACSSSLVAIHMACQSLRYGEINMAIAGGVSLMIAPELMVSMSKIGFMSPDRTLQDL